MSRGAETEAHRTLKRLAVRWAQVQGYAASALEVALPHSAYRADVAAYRPALERVREPDPREPSRQRFFTRSAVGSTAVFECKQARSDFLKDARASAPARAKLARLQDRRLTLERTLRVHFPTLRTGDTLFPECEAGPLDLPEHESYRRVLAQMQALQTQLFRGLKFEKLIHYRCANLCYLVVEPGLFAAGEVPLGWGLLVREEDRLSVRQRPTLIDSGERTRLALLHRIAQAGTRALNRDLGLSGQEI